MIQISKFRGYTLVEMLVVISISTLILGVVVNSILSFYRANTNTLEQGTQISEARHGVDQMVRDIREASYADTGDFPLVSVGSTSLTFYSDIDRDAATERVRYFLSGTTLYKGVINATGSPLAYNSADEQLSVISLYIRNNSQGTPIFRYYSASSTEITAGTTTTTAISYISVNLVVNVNPDRLPGEFTLNSTASIRNLNQ